MFNMPTPEKAADFLAGLGYDAANIGRALHAEYGTDDADAERIAGVAKRNAAVRQATEAATVKADRQAIAAEHKEE